MKLIATILSLVIFSFTNGQTKNPFLTLQFDKVVFYDIEDSREKGSRIVDDNGRKLMLVVKEVQVDKNTVAGVSARLGNKLSYGAGTAACFEPHCGFVYFYQGKPVAQVSICLSCNRLYSTIDIPAQKQGKQGSGKDVYYMLDGLSKSFRQFINGLLAKNRFSHQKK